MRAGEFADLSISTLERGRISVRAADMGDARAMRLKHACLWAGLAVVAIAAPAQAADLDRGVIRERVGVPVPAPIPVADQFRWYVRADIGIGLGQEPDVTERGLVYGNPADPSSPPLGISSAWFNKDFDTFFTGGAGVGLYITPRLRGDITVDARSQNDIKVDQFGSYTSAANNNVNFHTWEQTQVHDFVTLANLYWDLTPRGTGITPYIGVGAGFAVRSLDRRHITNEDTDGDGVRDDNSWSGQSKSHQVAPAAAAMAGIAWDLSPGTVVDISYRFTWLGSVDMSTPLNGASSRITIGDTFDHEIRAGLRWNVW